MQGDVLDSSPHFARHRQGVAAIPLFYGLGAIAIPEARKTGEKLGVWIPQREPQRVRHPRFNIPFRLGNLGGLCESAQKSPENFVHINGVGSCSKMVVFGRMSRPRMTTALHQ